MKLKTIGILTGFFLFIGAAAQANESPTIVEVKGHTTYTPMGFDDNDVAQIVVEGSFKNSCYRLKEVKTYRISEDQVGFRVFAYKYSGSCLQIITPFFETVDVGILGQGEYEVYNLFKGEGHYQGRLHVSEAATPGKRDEFEYAPVNSIRVMHRRGYENQRAVMLFGNFPNTCLKFIDQKLPMRRTTNNVIEVLPVMKKLQNDSCKQTPVPFAKVVYIPDDIPEGKYLFHIRTMDGTSFNMIDYLKSSDPVWGRPE
jgi:hypothetical protein